MHFQRCSLAVLLLATPIYTAAAAPPAPPELPQALRLAIREARADAITRLVATENALRVRDGSGTTPLMHAAFYSGAETVKLLLERDADPKEANEFGTTALMLGAGDTVKVRLLLEAAADPNARTKDGQTALLVACSYASNSETVKLLLSKGADANAATSAGVTPLMRAAAMGDIQTIKTLLAAGANVNVRTIESPTAFFSGWRTPLMWASLLGHTEVVSLLLEHGADVNGRDLIGTALVQAIWGRHYDIVKLLLDQGADVNTLFESPTTSGFTPLMWACLSDSDNTRLVELLLRRGAKLDVESDAGDTALSLARRQGETPLVPLLLKLGAPEGKVITSKEVVGWRREEALSLRPRIEKGIERVQASAGIFAAHRESREKCFSCHHQSVPAVTLGLAKRASFSIDAAAAAKQRDVVLRDQNGRQELLRVLSGSVDPASDAGFALFGLSSEKHPANEGIDAVVHALAASQQADGRWPTLFFRMPLSSGDITTTALGIRALREYGWPARRSEFDQRIRRAEKWLLRAQAESTDQKTFKLLGLSWAGADRAYIEGAKRELLAAQRPDGGWPQLPTLTSDAFSTGQALYALHIGGGLEVKSPAYQKGVNYLLETQAEDGTWFVLRRTYPFQSHFDSGFPYGKDQWISAAGTSWAAAALILSEGSVKAASH